jgi:signal transduction histidine kinase
MPSKNVADQFDESLAAAGVKRIYGTASGGLNGLVDAMKIVAPSLLRPQEVITLLQRELFSHEVSLRTELAPALPAILGDRVQLQQVIINLVMNGIEAMHSVMDRPRELVIRSRQDEKQQVLTSVTDCGVGLSAETADRLFNAFFTTKATGMGMGLSICRSIIEAHSGRLWATANLPHGVIFEFTLPPLVTSGTHHP